MIGIKTLLKRKKSLILVIVLIVFMLAGLKILGAGRPPMNAQASSNDVTVETETVKYSDSMGGITYKADLEPAEEASVSSNVSGQVTLVLFENGDKVAQGQVMAQLDDTDLQNQLKTAKIDLRKLQIELESAKSNFDITSQLYAEGACSKLSYDDAERTYQTNLANVELKQVEIRDITDSLDNCVIKAPISGEAGDKNISVGQYLNPGTVIASVKNNAAIKAEIQLKQDDLEKVTVGQEVTLKLNESDTAVYKGVVENIAASANSQTRSFDCLIKIDNSDGTLNSGVFGYIEIPDKNKTHVLAVPMEAVTGSEGAYFVLVMKDGTAHKVTIEIGEITGDKVEVKSGLKEGDVIIVTNLNSLQDGDKVKVEGAGSQKSGGEK